MEILESYCQAPNKPSERMAVWVSRFFGSGKSSFAKLLGLALANRQLGADTSSELLASHIGDPHVQVLIKTVVEKIQTEAVIFEVATERGVMHENQMLTEIMYRQLLEHLGYPHPVIFYCRSNELLQTLQAGLAIKSFHISPCKIPSILLWK